MKDEQTPVALKPKPTLAVFKAQMYTFACGMLEHKKVDIGPVCTYMQEHGITPELLRAGKYYGSTLRAAVVEAVIDKEVRHELDEQKRRKDWREAYHYIHSPDSTDFYDVRDFYYRRVLVREVDAVHQELFAAAVEL